MKKIQRKKKTLEPIQVPELSLDPSDNKPHIAKVGIKIGFWFGVGALLGIFLLISLVYAYFQVVYANKIYPGITIGGVDFGGKTQNDVTTYFAARNNNIARNTFTLQGQGTIATLSAKQLNLSYDTNLLATQAYSIGRSKDTFSNLSIILQAYINGVGLTPAYHYNSKAVDQVLNPLAKKLYVAPVNAVFNFENGRVTAFQESANGKQVDKAFVEQQVKNKISLAFTTTQPTNFTINIPIKTINPQITTDKVNSYGIKDLIGQGVSLYQGSDSSRAYNVALAASRINGTLIPPGQQFSFDQSVGDISSLSGYKSAYIISGGHTVLGDGGGVCQVSTTVFRAVLNAGLPITEHHFHAYRVGYYEENSPPGFDATIYSPTVDLKFENDTSHYILLQTTVDPSTQQLTVSLYGTGDGRQVTISNPVITSTTPAPAPLYQPDPSLPTGTVQQTDFAAEGTTLYFTRKVVLNGKTIINETYNANYQPWQAVYLQGTGT